MYFGGCGLKFDILSFDILVLPKSVGYFVRENCRSAESGKREPIFQGQRPPKRLRPRPPLPGSTRETGAPPAACSTSAQAATSTRSRFDEPPFSPTDEISTEID
jgi:hypothetical protein